MAKDLRDKSAPSGELENLKTALTTECTRQANSALYTSTSFFIWLRCLRSIRMALWILAAVFSVVGASSILLEWFAQQKVLIAGLTLMGPILPGIVKASKLDDTIATYKKSAAQMKNIQDRLHRAATVWSHKSYSEFETEARSAFDQLDKIREASLTPPEWCFKRAQKKVKAGDYNPD